MYRFCTQTELKFNDIPQSVLDILTLSSTSATLHLTSLLITTLLTSNHTSRHVSLLILSLVSIDENLKRLIEFIVELEDSADYGTLANGRYYNVEMAGYHLDWREWGGFKRYILLCNKENEEIWRERGTDDCDVYWIFRYVNKGWRVEDEEGFGRFLEWGIEIWDVGKVYGQEVSRNVRGGDNATGCELYKWE